MAILPGSQRLYQQHGGLGVGGPRLAAPAVAQGAGAGLAELGRALGDARPLAEALARGYREARTAEVDDEILRVDGEFAKWRAGYEAERQGRAAANAGAEYRAKHRELGAEALKRLGGSGDEVFEGLLARRLEEAGNGAEKAGLAYQVREDRAWKKSQWDAQLAAFERFAQDNAGDAEAIARERANLLGSWQAKNPGLDPGGFVAKLDESTAKSRFETLLLQGDFAGAQAVIDGAGASPAAQNAPRGTSGGGAGRDPRLYRGGQICEDLNNPLNLRKPGAAGPGREGYQYFATPEDGYRGARRQLLLYKQRGLVTPRQIISKWAPPSENDTEGYIREVCARLGVKDDAALDVADDAQAARLLKAMALKEGRLGQRHSASQIQRALSENGGKAEMMRLEPQAGGDVPRGTSGAAPGVLPGPGALFRARAQARLDAALEAKRREAEAEAKKNDWRVRQAVDDFLSQSGAGVVADLNVAEADIARAFGDRAGEAFAKIQAMGQFAIDAGAIRGMDAAAQDALLQSRAPAPGARYYAEAQAGHQRLARAIAEDRKLRAADPAGYAAANDAEAGAARKAFLLQPSAETFSAYAQAVGGARARLDLPGEAILGKEDAALLGRIVEGADNPAQELRRLEAMAGPAWPGVAREIAGSLSDLTLAITAGVPDDAAALLFAARRDPKFNEKTLEMLAGPLETKKDISDRLELGLKEGLEEFTKSMVMAGCASQAEGIYRGAFQLALQLMATRGMDADKAASQAAEQMAAGRYVFGKSPAGSTWRAPKQFDASGIERGCDAFLRDVPLSALAIQWEDGADPAMLGENFRAMLRRQTDWIVNPDESGFWFYINGKRLLLADGSPLEATWEDLARAGEREPGFFGRLAENADSSMEDY